MDKIAVFWFRRDFRLKDNHALFKALTSGFKVLPVFVFDTNILSTLPKTDHRVAFIHKSLENLNNELIKNGVGGIQFFHLSPIETFKKLTKQHTICQVYCNEDYEPYARERDKKVAALLNEQAIPFKTFTDHVLNNPQEVLKADGMPYSVFTPYKNKVLQYLANKGFEHYPSEKNLSAFCTFNTKENFLPSLDKLGFTTSTIPLPKHNYTEKVIENYAEKRDFPAQNNTSKLSPFLRFGLISTRGLAKTIEKISATFLTELIWRDFYQMILWWHPQTIEKSFKPIYDQVEWTNNPLLFEKWCAGQTGFPIVDAGMRELNNTGFMHNRVRMIVASFLCKDLQIDWRWGEAYFAEKLYDFELASNVGGWQWAASSGCDAAPYFRIFNPELQLKRFDPNLEYLKKWVPEYNSNKYIKPIIDHKEARERCLITYKKAINN